MIVIERRYAMHELLRKMLPSGYVVMHCIFFLLFKFSDIWSSVYSLFLNNTDQLFFSLRKSMDN
jgi:hypothetical protein